MDRVYLALAAIGALLPLSAFVPWLVAHGADPAAFVAELFATRIGAFFGWDVIVSAVVLILFVLVEGRGVRHGWLAIPATLLVGVSCGLPLFLALRARSVQGAAP
ncbi:DUF2834 domain-containing protein [Sphingomonas profundi]|uniref:DUF2834 domain-containing protein n=1 Tax=Alterirhizorhabdus profundi TaxID=2681549 RepID=UPI0012E9440F|nr:DUF2834 domain-containing protein [Sphingomonas profundi]